MPTVMIVDDDPRLRAALQFKLEQAGYRICVAGNGRDCLDQIVQQRPDLILLDLMMPDISGLEVLEWLRSDPSLSSIPVLVVTAWGHTEMRSKCLSLGAAGFIAKPFSLRDLARKVDEQLS